MMWKKIKTVHVVVFVGNLLALTGDTTLTWSSPVLPKLHSNNTDVNPLGRKITEEEASWIGSLLYIGAIIGMLPSALLADKIGRKITLILLSIPHIISYLMFAFAQNIALLYAGRILSGISLSAVYVVLPMYVAEICNDSYRGMMLVSYTTFASFGGLLPYVIGPYTSMLVFNIIIVFFPLVFLPLFIFLAPESPYYFVKKNQEENATNSLMRLRGKDKNNVKNEIEIIKEEISHTSLQPNLFKSLKSKHVIKGFIIALALGSFQQLSGISAILSYTEIIFLEAGSNISTDISSIIIGLILLVASILSPFVVDMKGRKFLLILSSTGIIISEGLLGIYFYIQDYTDTDITVFSWLPMICLVAYMAFFNFGLGPLPFTIASEILPSDVKFSVVTIAGFGCWTASFLVDKFFLDLDSDWGRGETFFLFMLFTICLLLFVIFYVPETNGKSFQEIQQILEK